jgi:hypothetical protein
MPAIKFIAGVTASVIQLLDEYQPVPTSRNERLLKVPSVSLNAKPIASKQNMEKLSVSTFFSYIAGVIDTIFIKS